MNRFTRKPSRPIRSTLLLILAFCFIFDVGFFTSDSAAIAIDPTPFFSKSFAPNPAGLGTVSTLSFTIDNSASASAATGLGFTDNLPAGLLVATPPNASTTCTGGTITAVAGSSAITYTGGSVAAGASCTVQVDVVSSATGFLVNTTGDLTSSAGNSGPATDTLAVDPAPAFSKNFAPDKIAIGGVSTLTFAIDNSLSTSAATGLDFTDNLPAAVVIATPANASTDCTGGTLTATDGTNVITYTGGSVAAGASCTVSVDVTSSTAGSHVNTSGDLTSSLGNSGSANDTLQVNPPPGFSKTFGPNPILTNGTSTLTFTIDNSGSTAAATALDFTDNLPAEIVIVTPSNASTDCTGGTLTATDGTNVITYTGGSVAAGVSCTVSVDVTSSTDGSHVNTTGALTSSLGTSGTANDTLTVASPTSGRYLLSVFKSGDGSGTVTSTNIPGINCGPDCGQYANPRSTISLNAVPDEGSVFEGWSGVCTGTGGCTVYMNGNRTVTAAFSRTDSDGDGTPDDKDRCPNDPGKIEPGACGCGMPDDDNDNNGIPDCLDTDDSDIPEDLDMDGDGIPDRDQDDLRVVAGGADGDLFIGIAAPPGVDLAFLEWVDPSTIDDTVNRPDRLPLGLISFRGMTANPGDTVELVIYFSEPIPEDAVWYKYDPVNGWYDFSDYVVISNDRMSLTILIQDGGPGDADGEVNGVFDDPSGPGLFNTDDNGLDDDTTPVTPGSSGGSGGGCFLKAAESE